MDDWFGSVSDVQQNNYKERSQPDLLPCSSSHRGGQQAQKQIAPSRLRLVLLLPFCLLAPQLSYVPVIHP